MTIIQRQYREYFWLGPASLGGTAFLVLIYSMGVLDGITTAIILFTLAGLYITISIESLRLIRIEDDEIQIGYKFYSDQIPRSDVKSVWIGRWLKTGLLYSQKCIVIDLKNEGRIAIPIKKLDSEMVTSILSLHRFDPKLKRKWDIIESPPSH